MSRRTHAPTHKHTNESHIKEVLFVAFAPIPPLMGWGRQTHRVGEWGGGADFPAPGDSQQQDMRCQRLSDEKTNSCDAK